jgi:hypothetical protein
MRFRARKTFRIGPYYRTYTQNGLGRRPRRRPTGRWSVMASGVGVRVEAASMKFRARCGGTMLLMIVTALLLAGCARRATDAELDGVCLTIRISVVGYKMPLGWGVKAAHDLLREQYHRTPEEAADITDEALRTRCPQYRP